MKGISFQITSKREGTDRFGRFVQKRNGVESPGDEEFTVSVRSLDH